jgi:hypothetical protein
MSAANAAADAAADAAANTAANAAADLDSRFPRCGKRFCSGIGEVGAGMLRRRDLERVSQVAAAEAATTAAKSSCLAAWAEVGRVMRRADVAEARATAAEAATATAIARAVAAEEELQRRHDAARWRAERSSAVAAATPSTPRWLLHSPRTPPAAPSAH